MKLVLDLKKSIPPEGYEFDGAEARIIEFGERYAKSNPIPQLWRSPTSTYGKYFALKRAKWEPKIGDEVWDIVLNSVCKVVIVKHPYGSLVNRCRLVRGPFKTKEAALAALDQLNDAPTGE